MLNVSYVRIISMFCASAMLFACNKPESEKPEPEKPDKNLPQIVIDVQGNINVSLEGGEVSIPYSIVNPVDGGKVSGNAEVDWITDFADSDTAVVCFVLENTEIESRNAVVTLTYEYPGAAEPISAQVNLIQEPAVDWDYDMTATAFQGHYYDTRYGHNGEYNYYTWLSDKPFDENGSAQPGGTYYLFDMYAGAPDDPLKPLPPAGTYLLGEDGSTAEMTFSNSYSRVTGYNDLGEESINEYFSEGTLVVVYENDSLKMEAQLTDRAGALHRVVYAQPVPEYLFGDGGLGEEYLTIERDMNVVPVYAGASYFSDENGIMEVYMTFSDMKTDSEGEFITPGSALRLEGVYMPLDEDGKIAVGTYNLTSEYGDAFTMYAGEMYELLGYLFPYGCYLEYTDEEGDVYYGFAVEGTMDVKESNGIYDITCNFKTPEGHSVTCRYSGELEVTGVPGPLSTLTEDYTLEFAETSAIGYYYGDIMGTGGGNWYVKVSPSDGMTGDGFITYLVGEGLDFAAGIPSGTYKAAASANYISPNEYQVGYMSGSGLGGTMYLGGYTESGVTSYAPATSGDLYIENHGDGTYTFSFSFLDDKGFTWDGEWTGRIDFSNSEYSPAGPGYTPCIR